MPSRIISSNVRHTPGSVSIRDWNAASHDRLRRKRLDVRPLDQLLADLRRLRLRDLNRHRRISLVVVSSSLNPSSTQSRTKSGPSSAGSQSIDFVGSRRHHPSPHPQPADATSTALRVDPFSPSIGHRPFLVFGYLHSWIDVDTGRIPIEILGYSARSVRLLVFVPRIRFSFSGVRPIFASPFADCSVISCRPGRNRHAGSSTRPLPESSLRERVISISQPPFGPDST